MELVRDENGLDTLKQKKQVNFASSLEEVFNTAVHASATKTPVYIKPEDRQAHCVAPPSTISRPNYEGINLK
jgi:hypothetical protein